MTTSPFPVRPPAPGPALVLDLTALWRDVEAAMEAAGMPTNPKDGRPQLKALCDATGLDRNTVGRIRRIADSGKHTQSQRGGVNVNAFLTLAAFAGGTRLATNGLLVFLTSRYVRYARIQPSTTE